MNSINTSFKNSTEWNVQTNDSCFYLTRFLIYAQEPLRISFIINCALNVFLSITAIVGNTSILWALKRCSPSLRPPSKALLCSLSLSDLAVGVLVQPLYVVYKVAETSDQFRIFCIAGIAFHLSANVFQAVSFLTVTAISLDRLLALYLQTAYNAKIYQRRAWILLFLLWSSTSLWVVTWFINITIYQIFNVISVCICLVICASAYITLQIRLRKQQTVIKSRFRNHDQNEPKGIVKIHTPHLHLYQRSVTTMFYIYILLILCYAPYWLMFIVIQITGRNSTKIAALSFSMTLLFANASVNPFLYCWRIHEVRKEILKILDRIRCRK